MRIWPGSPYPLGATWTGTGINVALASETAEAVDLCVFEGSTETRVRLPGRTASIWHGFLPDARPGFKYGYRVHGPWDPHRGLRFNPSKLLIDPYARALEGDVRWTQNMAAHPPRRDDMTPDHHDNARSMPKAVCLADDFDWQDDAPPRTPWTKTVFYEAHVRGLTKRLSSLSRDTRGTYAALGTPEVTGYLNRLGVTALELMPIQYFVDDRYLVEQGLVNYWGYQPIGYFAPAPRYAKTRSAAAVGRELKNAIRSLHAAGIEVIMDVVFNHTAEGNEWGQTLSFRGIDNPTYYRLAGDQRFYTDLTGTGNTLNTTNPRVLQLVLDSLRYWVSDYHIDGFRFDLATVLGRDPVDFRPDAALLAAIAQDPVLSQVKLVAEPWDLGMHGYQVGGFPSTWAEWNGRYRDTVRSFWRGDQGRVAEMASRLTGSSDLYQRDHRPAWASVNFVTAHDGFTLRDLVSYAEKHNESNGEENRDGEAHNYSVNFGTEGPSEDPLINAKRDRFRRNLMATMIFSVGIPLLLAGDEIGRTQRGNNNAYPHDSEVSWLDWDSADEPMIAFVQRALALRQTLTVLQRQHFFSGEYLEGRPYRDVTWYRPDGSEMTGDDWSNTAMKSFTCRFESGASDIVDQFGERVPGPSLLCCFNAATEPFEFQLPHEAVLQIDTNDDSAHGQRLSTYVLADQSFAIFTAD